MRGISARRIRETCRFLIENFTWREFFRYRLVFRAAPFSDDRQLFKLSSLFTAIAELSGLSLADVGQSRFSASESDLVGVLLAGPGQLGNYAAVNRILERKLPAALREHCLAIHSPLAIFRPVAATGYVIAGGLVGPCPTFRSAADDHICTRALWR